MKDNQQHAPLHILLADDDVDDRFFFDKALKEIPIDTDLVTVYNGEQLMKYLGENTDNLPDLLFLDLSMPRKTGFECLSEIKENMKLKDLPVIMFTTSFTRGIDFEENLKNTLYRMGAMDYIRKPGDFKELKQVIHQTLRSVLVKEPFTNGGNNL
jgi:CheY-like chemotaxis protein